MPELPQDVIDAITKVRDANAAVDAAKATEANATAAAAAAAQAQADASTARQVASDAAHKASSDMIAVVTAAFPNAFA